MTPNTIYSISCPECGKTWEFECFEEEIARKVDASLHYVDEHGGVIPDDAPFGNYQCPECLDVGGLNGTASCSECGYVPEGARWKASTTGMT
jgi:hypothetical protein